MFKQAHLSPKLMKMMKTNLYTNLLDHHILVYIKSYNGIIPLTIPWEHKERGNNTISS
jgi:hypothetical protein